MHNQPKPIGSLKGIGPVSAGWLASVGIETEADLVALGAVEAYRRAKSAYPDRVSLNLLYGLAALLMGIDWRHLPVETKEDLKWQVGQ